MKNLKICHIWLVDAIESIYYNSNEYKLNVIKLKLYLFVYNKLSIKYNIIKK